MKADAAVVYHKGVRNAIAANDRGEVTAGILHSILPFNEEIVFIERTGKELFSLVDYGIFKKFFWAGIKAEIEEKDVGRRYPKRKLRNLFIYSREKGKFLPVEEEEKYILACPAFFGRVFVRPEDGDRIFKSGVKGKEALAKLLLSYRDGAQILSSLDPLANGISFHYTGSQSMN